MHIPETYTHDLSRCPIRGTPCKTCPFAGTTPIPLSPKQHSYYLSQIVTLKSQHICHSEPSQTLCRGGREILLKVLTAMGAIASPTDEEYERALKKILEREGKNEPRADI